MAQEAERPRHWSSMVGLVLATFVCAAIPLYHGLTGSEKKSVLILNLDSVYVFIFLLGTGTISAIAALNRRIAALEEKNESIRGKDAPGTLSPPRSA
jgi:hypothetical protein